MPYPIAINGTIKSIKQADGEILKDSVITLTPHRVEKDPTNPENGLSLAVDIWAKDFNLFHGLAIGDEIVVLGIWRVSPSKTTEAKKDGPYKTFTNRKLVLSLQLKAQIAVVTD